MARKKQGESNRIELVLQDDEVAEFKLHEQVHEKRFALPVILLFIWLLLYVFAIIFGISRFNDQAGILFSDVFDTPAHKFADIKTFMEETVALVTGSRFTYIGDFYCTYMCAGLAGAALAACGAIFQGSFKNVLAGPSTMGVMSGGSLGCMVFLLAAFVFGAFEASNGILRVLFTLAGCVGGVALVLGVALAAGRGKVSSSAMIIAGTVFSGVTSNILLLAQYFILAQMGNYDYGTIMQDFGELMMGHFFSSDSLTMSPWGVVGMGVPVLACCIFLCVVAGKINVLSLSEDEARSAGVNVAGWRNLMIVIGTVLTACVVSFCGRIGFVGFMVPLVMRRFTGPDMKRLLPCSMLGGAIFLTVIVYIAVLLGMSSYISVITGPVGCVVMIIALMRKRGDGRATADGGAGANMGLR